MKRGSKKVLQGVKGGSKKIIDEAKRITVIAFVVMLITIIVVLMLL